MLLSVLVMVAGLALYAAHAGGQDEKKGAEKQPNPTAVMELEKGGTVEMEVYTTDSPITAGNFVKLAEKKFYDGVVFHRVIPGFVAQTGDPTGTGMGGPGYTIKDEKTPYKHDKGAVGMAKTSQPDSAGSQWYICLEPQHQLDSGYTVFGKVTKGMDLVEKIKIGDKIKTLRMKQPEAKKADEQKPAEEK